MTGRVSNLWEGGGMTEALIDDGAAWAIAEGRATAAAVDEYLQGETQLPFPVKPTDRPISVYS